MTEKGKLRFYFRGSRPLQRLLVRLGKRKITLVAPAIVELSIDEIELGNLTHLTEDRLTPSGRNLGAPLSLIPEPGPCRRSVREQWKNSYDWDKERPEVLDPAAERQNYHPNDPIVKSPGPSGLLR